MTINIIGAGITGLASAYFLLKKAHQVNMFKSAPEVGGLSGFFPVEGTYLEKYYHYIFSVHAGLIDLMKELNMKKSLCSARLKHDSFMRIKSIRLPLPKGASW